MPSPTAQKPAGGVRRQLYEIVFEADTPRGGRSTSP